MKRPVPMSIVTPSFNQGRFIERTIESVLSQDVPGLEYMVMDGGSTDETLSILKRYGDRFFWVSEPDRGPSDAINKGLLSSSGPILGWLNSDDVYYPGALSSVLEFFENHPDVDVVYGDTVHINENDEYLENYPTEDWNWERFNEICFISQPAAFFRRRVLVEFGPLETGLRCMDYEYWLRLGKGNARFFHLRKLLAATRLHKDAFTVFGRVAGFAEVIAITRKHLSRTPDQWLYNYAHAVAESKGYYRYRRFLAYSLTVLFFAIYSAIRWNRSVSRNMIKRFMRLFLEESIPGIRRAFWDDC